MNWLQEAFLEPTMVQAVIIISLVSALGFRTDQDIRDLTGYHIRILCRYLGRAFRDRRE